MAQSCFERAEFERAPKHFCRQLALTRRIFESFKKRPRNFEKKTTKTSRTAEICRQDGKKPTIIDDSNQIALPRNHRVDAKLLAIE